MIIDWTDADPTGQSLYMGKGFAPNFSYIAPALQPLGVLIEPLSIRFISVRRSVASRSIERGMESKSIKREVKP